jgi:hypothetical protein
VLVALFAGSFVVSTMPVISNGADRPRAGMRWAVEYGLVRLTSSLKHEARQDPWSLRGGDRSCNAVADITWASPCWSGADASHHAFLQNLRIQAQI